MDDRLARQLAFVVELDRLKGVLRRTYTIDGARRENSAEHSWHLAAMAVVLAEHAPAGADPLRVLKMLLLHDVVEIDADDTFCYDANADLDRAARERLAAARLFGLLPDDAGAELQALWEEFEAGDTADARWAVALDRLQPLLLNAHHATGGSWREHGISRAQVMRRMAPIAAGAPGLWEVVERVVDEAAAAGHLVP